MWHHNLDWLRGLAAYGEFAFNLFLFYVCQPFAFRLYSLESSTS